MKNIPLLIFDSICLPITLIRLFLIYLFGSRYNVASLQFLDVMNHANNKYFNQGQGGLTTDVVTTDVRVSINRGSKVNAELLNETLCKPYAVTTLQQPIDEKRKVETNSRTSSGNSIFGSKGSNQI